jgi:hypothetical protein
MGRRKARMTVGAKYTAIGAITEAMHGLRDLESSVNMGTAAEDVAAYLVEQAWDVESFPVAGKVTITFDLSRLDQPAEVEPAVQL